MKGLQVSNKIRFADLISKIADETGASEQFIRQLLRETVNLTKEGLKRDGRVNIAKFGHFNLKWQAARPGRNPSTGDAIEIPAQSKVTFKSEAGLRNFINREYSHLKPEFIKEETATRTEYAAVKQGSAVAVESPVLISPGEEQKTETRPHEAKKISAWFWLVALLGVMVILFLLWSKWEPPAPTAVNQNLTESVIQEIPKTIEEQAPPVEAQPPAPTAVQQNLTENVIQEVPKMTEVQAQPVKAIVSEKMGVPGGQHSVQSGDNIWTIAGAYYEEPFLWPNIYRANLVQIENPDYLLTGLPIHVPPLEGKISSLTNNDLANVAEGYVHAYLVYKKYNKADAKNYLWVACQYDSTVILNRFADKIDQADLRAVQKINKSVIVHRGRYR